MEIESVYQDRNINDELSHNDRNFLHRVYSDGLSKYIERLKQIGFTDCQSVLDAGCGFGQWSMALSQITNGVVGMDAEARRVVISQRIADMNDLENINFVAGSLEQTPFSDERFEAVFCYSVLYATDIDVALQELYRVLEPGGKLYINTNGYGYYLSLLFQNPNATSDYYPRRFASKTLINSLLPDFCGRQFKQGVQAMTPQGTKRSLEAAGFVDVTVGADGQLGAVDSESSHQFFDARYLSIPKVFECLASKPEL